MGNLSNSKFSATNNLSGQGSSRIVGSGLLIEFDELGLLKKLVKALVL